MMNPKLPNLEYTAKFKALAVKPMREGQTARVMAHDLGLVEQTLRT